MQSLTSRDSNDDDEFPIKYVISCLEDEQRRLVDTTALEIIRDYQRAKQRMVILEIPLPPLPNEDRRKVALYNM